MIQYVMVWWWCGDDDAVVTKVVLNPTHARERPRNVAIDPLRFPTQRGRNTTRITTKETQTTTMSSSNNAFYGFEDDDTTTSPVKPPANGTKKKKKKKKSKKSSDKNKGAKGSAGLSNNPAALLKQKLLSAGYSSAKIDACMDQMFSSGERYDDYDSVKAKLDGKTNDTVNNTEPSKHSNTSTKNQDADGFVPVKTNHQKVRAAAKRNVAANGGGDGIAAQGDEGTGSATGQAPNAPDAKPEASISDRLEAATKMKPVSTVMEVLTRWCQQFPDDLIELFRCKAAAQLFENYLSDRYSPTKQTSSNDVTLMANLLTCIFKQKLSKYAIKPFFFLHNSNSNISSIAGTLIMSNLQTFVSALKDLNLDSDEWRRVVKRYSNLLASRLGEFMQYGDQVESIPQELKTLQAKLQANIVAADDFENDSKDEKLANMFRKRDLACERVVLGNLIRKNATKLAKAVSSSQPTNADLSRSTPQSEKSDARILEALGMSIERINESNQKGEEAKEVQKQLDKLRKENKTKIAPLEVEEKQVNDKLAALEARKKALLQELESVQGELDILHGTKSSVTARKAELNLEMEAKLAKLDNEHKGMAVHIRRAESQAKIAGDFRAFDEELDRQSKNGSDGAKIVQERLRKALQKIGGGNAVSKCSNDVLRTAVSYTRMESSCLSAMRSRVKENKEKILKTVDEIASMKSLGLTNVVGQLERSEKQLAQYIQQDEGVIGALSNKAVEIFSIVKAIGDDHANDINSLDGLTSDLLQKLKQSFIQLNVGTIGRHWDPPRAETSNDHESNSMFSSNLAASLGLTSANSTTESQSVSKPTEKSKTASKKEAKKKQKGNGNQKAGAAKKMGWGSLPKQEKKGKSLLELQREELEGRLTEENLRRLEIGKAPAKSPLLDRLNQAIESGQ